VCGGGPSPHVLDQRARRELRGAMSSSRYDPASARDEEADLELPPAGAPTLGSLWDRWRDVGFLSVGWMLAIAAFFIQVSNTPSIVLGLTGGDKGTSTLSLGAMILVAAATAVPGSFVIGRWGHRAAYLTGGAGAVAGAAVQALGMHRGSVALLIVGSIPQGYMYALANTFRFAAQEFVEPRERPRALAMLVAGAVLSAVVGPEVGRSVRGAVPGSPFTGVYVYECLLYVAQLCAVGLAVRWGALGARGGSGGAGRGPGGSEKSDGTAAVAAGAGGAGGGGGGGVWEALAAPLRSPRFTLAMLATAWAYVWMAALMSATPVVMAANGYRLDLRVFVIEVHLVCMFLPAFLSGGWVQRFGPVPVMTAGFALEAVATALYYCRPEGLYVYFVALAVMGVGWNLAYVGASVVGSGYLGGVQGELPKRVATGLFDTAVLLWLGVGLTTVGYSVDGIGWFGTLGYYLGIGGVFTAVSFGFLLHGARRAPGGGGPGT